MSIFDSLKSLVVRGPDPEPAPVADGAPAPVRQSRRLLVNPHPVQQRGGNIKHTHRQQHRAQRQALAGRRAIVADLHAVLTGMRHEPLL